MEACHMKVREIRKIFHIYASYWPLIRRAIPIQLRPNIVPWACGGHPQIGQSLEVSKCDEF